MEVTDVQYKESEIGVIPVDWEVVQLRNATIKIGSGITPTGGARVYKDTGRVFLRSQNIGLGKLLLNDVAYIDEETHQTFQSTEIQDEDLFLNITGASIGRSAVANFLVVKGNVNQHVCIVRTKQDVLNPYFLNYFLLSHFGQKQIDSFQAGGNRQGLNFGQIESFRIPIPSKSEQTAIATVLSDTDALIENLEKLIAKKRNIKQGVMQELLEPRNDWEIKRLGDFIKFQTGFPFSSEYFSDKPNGQRLIKNRDLRSDDSIVYYLGDYTKEFIVQNGDLLIGMDGDFESVLWEKGNALLNQRVGRVLKVKEISIPFLSYTLLKKLKEIEIRTSSTTVKHLSHSDIEKIEMPLPYFEKQNLIATILTDMDSEIYALEKKLNKAKQIKQGMMQSLLTGKIRLV